MTPETILNSELARNSPAALIAIIAILIVYKLAEQKVKMAMDIAEQHKEIAARYKELVDSSKEWGQQWILALDRNTDAFTANMGVMSETKDVVRDMKGLLTEARKKTARAK